MHTRRSYDFSHAITRLPSPETVNGLRAFDTGVPDIQLFLEDHPRYVATLKLAGATVVELQADEAFPDSVFVEDAALCLPEGAVIMRPVE